jgi:hypothetical protein
VGHFDDVTRLCNAFVALVGRFFEPCDQSPTIGRPLSFSHVLWNCC